MKFRETIEQGHDYVIPPLCYYEIKWQLQRKNANAQMSVFDDLYNKSFAVACISEGELTLAAEIKVILMNKSIPIGKNGSDIFIASHCIVNDYTLVTNNTSDFLNIDGLRLVNWKK